MSERVLYGGVEFVRVLRGYYLEACWGDDLASRCAAVCEAEPRAVVSHWTALQLRRLPVPAREDGRIHVTVPAGVRRRLDGVHVHRSVQPALPTRGELPVSGPGWAWCDAAALLAGPARADRLAREQLGDLVATADVLFGRRPRTRAAVRAYLADRPGERGSRLATRALQLVDVRAESPMESRLRVLLVLAGLSPEAVQHVVTTPDGRFVARVDLAYPARRVVVEYDGDHHRQRRQWRSDLARRERLERLGWAVVVVTGADLLGRPEAVVRRVQQTLAA